MSAYKKEIEVRWSDVDANSHLRHSAYADIATHSRIEWLKENGLPVYKLAQMNIGIIIFSESTQYKKEVYLSEKINLDLKAVGFSSNAERWHFRQHFYKENGDIAAIHEVVGSWIDPIKRKLSVVPQEVVDLVKKVEKADDYQIIEINQSN